MQRFLSSLSLSLLLSATVASSALALTFTPSTGSLAAPLGANYLVDAAINEIAGTTNEKTTAAKDTATNDVNLQHDVNSAIYMGFEEKFDGIALSIAKTAPNGSYQIQYWNGSTWSPLTGLTTRDISGALFTENWDRPSDWQRTTVTMDVPEGFGVSTPEESANLYFVRMIVTEAYDNNARFSQLGIVNYNLKLTLEDEDHRRVTDPAASLFTFSGGSDNHVYNYKEHGEGVYSLALHANTGTSYNLTPHFSDYVEKTYPATVTKARQEMTLVLQEKDAGQDGIGEPDLEVTDIDIESDEDITFTVRNSGEEDVDPSDRVTIEVKVDGRLEWNVSVTNSTSTTFLDEDTSTTYNVGNILDEDESGDQEVEVCVDTDDNVREESETNNCETVEFDLDDIDDNDDDSDGPDLVITDIYLDDDDDVKFVVKNRGDESVDSDDRVKIEIEVDDHLEWDEEYRNSSSSTTFLDEGKSNTYAIDVLSGNDRQKIEICVDTEDEVNEDSESNNCRTENLDPDDEDDHEPEDDDDDDDDSDGPDLTITDIYLNSDDEVRFVVKNKGDESVSSSDTVTIEIEVDNRLEWDEDYRNSSSSSNFLDEGKSSTYEADVLDNDDDSQKIEVCVDTEDEVDEDSESNNCRTETLDPDDEDDHEPEDDRNDSDFEYCGAFTDLNGYGWAEDQICDLYVDGVVNGRSYNRYEPGANITRAEFLKMALLSAGEDPSYTTGVYYRDVRSTDWYYSYVSYGTSRGYVNGYGNNEFRPNAYITRAEALVMLMRIYDEENFDFDDSDIEFWDVREWDWFAYAVVLGDEAGFINGYGDGSFRPHNFITRAEAAVMVVGANEAFE